jgi:hypothetical protein
VPLLVKDAQPIFLCHRRPFLFPVPSGAWSMAWLIND